MQGYKSENVKTYLSDVTGLLFVSTAGMRHYYSTKQFAVAFGVLLRL